MDRPWVRRSRTLLLLLRASHVQSAPNVRLYTPHAQSFSPGGQIALAEGQRKYLASVMRFKASDTLSVFNGCDGEWTACVEVLDKRRGEVRLLECVRSQPPAAAEPVLLFGVLKGARLPLLVEKSCELGVGALQPVVTKHCAARALNVGRMQAIAIEAAEQSRRLTVPRVAEPTPLHRVLDGWDPKRPLLVCDERGEAPPLSSVAASVASAGPGVLIGPEGGFAADEFDALASRPFVRLVSLGTNTLRAETAALAALAVLACR